MAMIEWVTTLSGRLSANERRVARSRVLPALAFVFVLLLPFPSTTAAQEQPGDETLVPRWLRDRLADRLFNRRDNPELMQLVRPVTEPTADSVVGVICGGRAVALGTVVARENQPEQAVPAASTPRDVTIITKRSELTGDPIRVRLSDGQMLPARVAAVRRRNDLALLVVEANGQGAAGRLRPVRFEPVIPAVGSFVISTERGGRAFGVGVIGTGTRTVEHRGGLGVRLGQVGDSGARVVTILPDSAADQAGLEQGDKIVAIDGRLQQSMETVVTTLHAMFPGEVVRLTIERNGDTVDISAKLNELTLMQESENDARVNGPRSVRLTGFERVLQHDTVLNPDQCGGPLIDLEGRVIGINIARAGRVVSYSLPSSLIAAEVASMIAEVGGK